MLMGQSAGAHLAAMLLLEHGLLEAKSFGSVFLGKVVAFYCSIFGEIAVGNRKILEFQMLYLSDCQAKHTAEGKDFVDNWSVKDFGPKGSKHNSLVI